MEKSPLYRRVECGLETPQLNVERNGGDGCEAFLFVVLDVVDRILREEFFPNDLLERFEGHKVRTKRGLPDGSVDACPKQFRELTQTEGFDLLLVLRLEGLEESKSIRFGFLSAGLPLSPIPFNPSDVVVSVPFAEVVFG